MIHIGRDVEKLLKKKTHFQNRGKNWAPVPDLCMSKLSVGSPCYDTCWERKKKKREINKKRRRRRVQQWSEQVVMHCCIHAPHSRSASLLWCLYELSDTPDVPTVHIHQHSPRTLPSVCFLHPGSHQPDVKPKKGPKNKKQFDFCFAKLLPSIGKPLRAAACKLIHFTIVRRDIAHNLCYAWSM